MTKDELEQVLIKLDLVLETMQDIYTVMAKNVGVIVEDDDATSDSL